MNRHERRKKRAQERKGRRGDTMGAGYQTGPLPRHVLEHPAFLEGQRAGREGKLPQRYYDDIREAALLMCRWVKAQPTKPDLRWVEQRDDGVFVAAPLDAADLLADSPDAFRMLAWLDEQTGRRLTINQVTWALRLCRALPMPDGSYHGVETKYQSPAMELLEAFLDDGKTVAVEPMACGHCGVALDRVSSKQGGSASPGALSVCFACLRLNRFDEQLRLVALTEAERAALPDETRAQIEDAVAVLRASRMRGGTEGQPRKGVAEA